MRNGSLHLPNLYAYRITKRGQPHRLVPSACNRSRSFYRSCNTNQQSSSNPINDVSQKDRKDKEREEGAMSRRLEEMAQRALEEGGQTVQKHVEEAGFSEELKQRLEARIADSKFRAENTAAFAQVNLPSSVGKGTRDIAVAEPWSGNEKLEDAALRMLNDARKPLRTGRPPKIPSLRGPPGNVDLRMRKVVEESRTERLANARDRTSIYALSQDETLSEKERDQLRKQLKERFTLGARPMPASIQGLAALANERIEDAIARGQFKNIPRGKGTNIERDYTASSPFLDTTEYFMNKIIQKQEIVPPWIEKQQELVKAASTFRSRLRADWKRHAARVIASKGGSLEAQVRRAEAYASAEEANNPKLTKVEAFTEIDAEGKLTQLTVTETPAPSYGTQDDSITVTATNLEAAAELKPSEHINIPADGSNPAFESRPSQPLPRVFPFRDPDWEKLELPYHTLALNNLNNLTRSYNLMAPDLAKKPYFSLDRELRSCFADVASQLPTEIRERARPPAKIKVEIVGHRPGGVLERFAGDKAKVYDTKRPNYGFKEFWRDLWGAEKERSV